MTSDRLRIRLSHCLHFNGSNSNKQYNWLPIVLLLFKQTMTSGTRDSMKYIRRGEEGVRASDIGPSENQASVPQYRAPYVTQTPSMQAMKAVTRYTYMGQGSQARGMTSHRFMHGSGGAGVLNKVQFCTGRLRPEFQTLTLLYTIFGRKGTPYIYIYLPSKIVALSYTYRVTFSKLFT